MSNPAGLSNEPSSNESVGTEVRAHGFGKAWRETGLVGPIALFMTVWPPIGGFLLLAFIGKLAPWLREHRASGIAVYVLLATVLIGLGITPTYSISIIAGWAYGLAVGFSVAMAALTLAGILAYWIGRRLSGQRIVALIRRRPGWRAVHDAMLSSNSGNTIFVITLLRIPPLSPYAISNFALASAAAPFRPYLIGTILGMAPRTFAAVFAAAQLEQLRFRNVEQKWITVTGILITLAVTGILGILARRAIMRSR